MSWWPHGLWVGRAWLSQSAKADEGYDFCLPASSSGGPRRPCLDGAEGKKSRKSLLLLHEEF